MADSDRPTPRDTPLSRKSTGQAMSVVRPSPELSECYRQLCEGIDSYASLEPELRSKLAAYMTRDRLIQILDIVERYLNY